MCKLLGAQALRRGDEVIALPESRRKERLLAGRTKLAPTDKTGENGGTDDGLQTSLGDTCIKAFVRLLAAQTP